MSAFISTEIYKKVKKKLNRLSESIKEETEENNNENCVRLENAIKDIYNLIYDSDYINLNDDNPNSPAIDLLEESEGHGIQITVSNTADKVTDTLRAFYKHDISEKAFKKLTILFFVKEDLQFKKSSLKNKLKKIGSKENPFPNVEIQIWNLKDFRNKLLKNLDPDKLEKINDYLKKNLTSSYDNDFKRKLTPHESVVFNKLQSYMKNEKIKSLLEIGFGDRFEYEQKNLLNEFCETIRESLEEMNPSPFYTELEALHNKMWNLNWCLTENGGRCDHDRSLYEIKEECYQKANEYADNILYLYQELKKDVFERGIES